MERWVASLAVEGAYAERKRFERRVRSHQGGKAITSDTPGGRWLNSQQAVAVSIAGRYSVPQWAQASISKDQCLARLKSMLLAACLDPRDGN